MGVGRVEPAASAGGRRRLSDSRICRLKAALWCRRQRRLAGGPPARSPSPPRSPTAGASPTLSGLARRLHSLCMPLRCFCSDAAIQSVAGCEALEELVLAACDSGGDCSVPGGTKRRCRTLAGCLPCLRGLHGWLAPAACLLADHAGQCLDARAAAGVCLLQLRSAGAGLSWRPQAPAQPVSPAARCSRPPLVTPHARSLHRRPARAVPLVPPAPAGPVVHRS